MISPALASGALFGADDDSDSEKSRRIAAIQKEGLESIVRVIARELSEHDALLVEKTLLADHLDTIIQGGGWSFRMWFSSGIVVPHANLSPPAPNRFTTPRAQCRDRRPLDKGTHYGIRQFSARSSNQKHRSLQKLLY